LIARPQPAQGAGDPHRPDIDEPAQSFQEEAHYGSLIDGGILGARSSPFEDGMRKQRLVTVVVWVVVTMMVIGIVAATVGAFL
jgi:hypothetical protein